MFAIYNLVHWITGISVINTINDKFSLINDISQSFRMLSSAKEIYELISWEYLSIDSTIQESKIWKIKLFCDLDKEYYWVQVDLRDSLQLITEYVTKVHIIID